MRPAWLPLVILVSAAVTLGCAHALPVGPTDPSNGHACTEVVGLPYAVLSFDGGKTLVQSRIPRRPHVEISSLVSLGTPYALAAVVDHELFVSADGGCHWASRGRLGATRIAEGHDGVAYAWGGHIFTVSLDGARQLHSPPAYVEHFGVDPLNKDHMRTLSGDGVFDSTDGGRSWENIRSVRMA